MGNESKGKGEERVHSGRHVASSVWQGHHILGLPRKENLFNQQKVQGGGGCSFSLRETSYTYMYLCTYVFFHSVTGRLPTTRQAGSIRK